MLIYKHSGSRLLKACRVLSAVGSILPLPCVAAGVLLDSGVLFWIGVACVPVALAAFVPLLLDDFRVVATLAAEEKGKEPLYSRTLRTMDIARPLVRLSIYSDLLVLKAMSAVVVRFAEVDRVETGRRRLWPCLWLHMRQDGEPAIEIPCADLKKVQRIVEERVKEEGSVQAAHGA